MMFFVVVVVLLNQFLILLREKTWTQCVHPTSLTNRFLLIQQSYPVDITRLSCRYDKTILLIQGYPVVWQGYSVDITRSLLFSASWCDKCYVKMYPQNCSVKNGFHILFVVRLLNMLLFEWLSLCWCDVVCLRVWYVCDVLWCGVCILAWHACGVFWCGMCILVWYVCGVSWCGIYMVWCV